MNAGRSAAVLLDAPDQDAVIAETRRKKSRLQAHLIPQPYVGDIRKADIVFCLLNPGFDFSNYISELPGTEFRRMKIANLHQEIDGFRYPFFEIDPVLAETGAFRWWWPKFEKMAEGLVADGREFGDAVETLARRVCCIEILPYHSKDGRALGDTTIAKMQSSRLAVAAVKAKAKEGSLVLLFRSYSNWGLEADGDRIVRVNGRSINVGKTTVAGKLIRNWMNR